MKREGGKVGACESRMEAGGARDPEYVKVWRVCAWMGSVRVGRGAGLSALGKADRD